MANPIRTCLWFDGQAKAAADFYCTIFPNARITTDTPMVVMFELNGHTFMGLNGGPQYQFNPAISFMVECADQAELDHYWNSLTADGGHEVECGWLTDRFGVSWQIVPRSLQKLMSDPARAERVMKVLLPMKKLDIAALEAA